MHAVNAAVDRKLAIIRDTYSALYDESSASRTELMEFLILVLIMAEIVIALQTMVRPQRKGTADVDADHAFTRG